VACVPPLIFRDSSLGANHLQKGLGVTSDFRLAGACLFLQPIRSQNQIWENVITQPRLAHLIFEPEEKKPCSYRGYFGGHFGILNAWFFTKYLSEWHGRHSTSVCAEPK